MLNLDPQMFAGLTPEAFTTTTYNIPTPWLNELRRINPALDLRPRINYPKPNARNRWASGDGHGSYGCRAFDNPQRKQDYWAPRQTGASGIARLMDHQRLLIDRASGTYLFLSANYETAESLDEGVRFALPVLAEYGLTVTTGGLSWYNPRNCLLAVIHDAAAIPTLQLPGGDAHSYPLFPNPVMETVVPRRSGGFEVYLDRWATGKSHWVRLIDGRLTCSYRPHRANPACPHILAATATTLTA